MSSVALLLCSCDVVRFVRKKDQNQATIGGELEQFKGRAMCALERLGLGRPSLIRTNSTPTIEMRKAVKSDAIIQCSGICGDTSQHPHRNTVVWHNSIPTSASDEMFSDSQHRLHHPDQTAVRFASCSFPEPRACLLPYTLSSICEFVDCCRYLRKNDHKPRSIHHR